MEQSRLTLSLEEKSLEDLIVNLVGPMMSQAKVTLSL